MTRNELAKNLRTLSSALSDWGKVKNADLLNKIEFKEYQDNIGYSISLASPLIFKNVDIDRHCLPSGIEKLPDTEVEVSLTTLHAEMLKDSDDHDLIKNQGVNIVVNACYLLNDELGEATCSWHIDKHNGTTTQYCHPVYHISFGGSHMENQPTNFGNLLLLNSPRVIHPPLDIILSCDFVIRNFYTKNNNKRILESRSYQSIIKFAKERYWKPFARAFVSEWYEEFKVVNLSSSSLLDY